VTASVEARLEEYRGVVVEAVATYLPPSTPGDHLYELAAEYPRRGGKAIRPALCLAAAEAFGGTIDDALPTAVAIELLHNAFLVHDDVEDESLLRRGRPTLHATQGVALAINAGDALAVLAQAPLRDNRSRLSNRIAATIAAEFDLMERRTLEGQAIELGWRRDNVCEVGPDDYLDLVLRKTCWYTTIHPLRTGALIGSWGRADLDGLVRFGFYLGAAFQIADDLLNLTPDATRYGKEAYGDLYEGKRSLAVIHLLGAAEPDDRRRVVEFLAVDRDAHTDAEVGVMVGLLERYGSVGFARSFGLGVAGAARRAYTSAFAGLPASPARTFIWEMVDWMLDRRW
jgi:geranylgeranyl diphosphate synthase type II